MTMAMSISTFRKVPHYALMLFLTSISSFTTSTVVDAQLLTEEYVGEVMGTELKIKALGQERKQLKDAVVAAVDEIRRVENLMTDWRKSPLTEINERAGSSATKSPKELVDIIHRSTGISEITDGAFDITYGSVGRLWSFKGNVRELPDPKLISSALKKVDYRKIGINQKNNTILLPEGVTIGLGGIAKGYGVDRAMQVLMNHGIKNALVNAGGDMKALGTNNGQVWEIAIKHPRNRERAMALVKISNSCVVTSGDYERFFEIDNKRYHHILNPLTGYPSTKAMSATVVAPNAEMADALATALVVLGPKHGLPIIEKLPRVEAILVDMDGDVFATTGMQNTLQRNN